MDPICAICRRGCEPGSWAFKNCHAGRALNVGSGGMINPNYINFDAVVWKTKKGDTDIIGFIENIEQMLPANYFKTILCVHTIEHFYYNEGKKVLKSLYNLLEPKGVLVMEGPDIKGIFELHFKGHPRFRTERQLATEIFGSDKGRERRGSLWPHKSGWTQDSMADELVELGFRIIKKTIGQHHGMGIRDFRVEGIKE